MYTARLREFLPRRVRNEQVDTPLSHRGRRGRPITNDVVLLRRQIPTTFAARSSFREPIQLEMQKCEELSIMLSERFPVIIQTLVRNLSPTLALCNAVIVITPIWDF